MPDAKALVARVEALYTAESERDWRACFELTAGAKTGRISWSEFQERLTREPTAARPVTWRIESIQPRDLEEGVREYATACVRLPMSVVVERQDGTRGLVEDRTDSWLYIDGEWFQGRRGIPADEGSERTR